MDMKIRPFEDRYRDDLIFMVLSAKEALGRTPHLNEDLLDIRTHYFERGDPFWIAVDEYDRVIGSVGCHRIDGGTEAWLHRLYVKPSLKRKGIGTALLKTAENEMFKRGINVVHVHLGEPEEQWYESYAFYPKHGYRAYAPRYLKKELGKEQPMREYEIVILRERPDLKEAAAQWFHEKWGVPTEAYLACMDAYFGGETEYGWYLCMDGDAIVGGLGVIENDFHDRKDLAPNVCAVYTEEAYRRQGIAGRLLDAAVEDQRSKGITPLYLVTDHTGFYERYGWRFLCMVQGDGEPDMTRMYIHD